MQTPAQDDPRGAYELGRLAEALSQNTRMIVKLTEAVEENSRSTAQLSNRQNRMEVAIESIQADLRKTINLSTTGQENEIEVRKRLEFLNRMYQKDLDAQGVMTHGKKAIYGAILVALLWWGWALIKDAAVAEVATQISNQSENRNKG